MPDSTCPLLEELADYLAGKVEDEKHEALTRHLDSCLACQGRLDSLAVPEQIPIARWLAVSPDQFESEWELRAVLALAETPRQQAEGENPQGAGRVPGAVPAMPRYAGNYELLEEIARGGMGVVYKARQTGLNRIVALKMLRAGPLASPQEIQRFQVEAEAAAHLLHPNIVPIYEVGEHNGCPYFSMAFVQGESLARQVAVRPLLPRLAAQLIKLVAEAVAYAHNQGVIHRDLKPGNILLDATGQPRVTDFGLAKYIDSDSDLTRTGQLMGTPSYMPPEQAEGRTDCIGPCSDVYSLGATLYCLLTGRPPFQAATALDTLKQVVEREAVPPRQLNATVDRDLDVICLKCLEKRPQRRYQSATELALDLGRFLDGRPIRARPVGTTEHAVRWLRRRPALTALAAAVILVTLLGVSGIVWKWREALDLAQAEALARTEAVGASERAEKSANEAREVSKTERWARYCSNLAAAGSALQMNNTHGASQALEAAPPEHRGWEYYYFVGQLRGPASVRRVLPGILLAGFSARTMQAAVWDLTGRAVRLFDLTSGKEVANLTVPMPRSGGLRLLYSPDGSRLVFGAGDGTIRLYDARAGKEITLLQGEVQTPEAFAFSPDGARLVAHDEKAGTLRMWDGVTGQPIAVPLGNATGRYTNAAFSTDGSRLIAGCSDGSLRIWDAGTGQEYPVGATLAHPLHRVVTGYGGRLAGSDQEGTIYLWSRGRTSQPVLLRGHTTPLAVLAFSPDGSRLVSVGQAPDTGMRLWDTTTGQEIARPAGSRSAVRSVIFAPDGKRFVSLAGEPTAWLWDGITGQRVALLRGHTGQLTAAVFSPDGTRLVTASEDQTLHLWEAAGGECLAVLRGHQGIVRNAWFSPDGTSLVSESWDTTFRIWDVARAESSTILRGHTGLVSDVSFCPDGTQLASSAWDHTVRLWEPSTGRQVGLLRHKDVQVTGVAYAPDGKRVATSMHPGGAQLWDLLSQKQVGAPLRPDYLSANERPTFSPNGSLLVLPCRGDGAIRLWAMSPNNPLAQIRAGYDVFDAAFRPDGAVLATTRGGDGTLFLWDVASRTQLLVLKGHHGNARVAYSKDGRILASASVDRTVRLWDARTYKELGVLQIGTPAHGVAFSPDGTRLVIGCADGIIRLWDVSHRTQVAELHGHTDAVRAVAFSPDGSRLASASADFTVRIWETRH